MSTTVRIVKGIKYIEGMIDLSGGPGGFLEMITTLSFWVEATERD